MSEVAEPVKPKRGRGRPPGAKNKPKKHVGLIPKEIILTDRKKIDALVKLNFSALKLDPAVARELKRLFEATGFTLQKIYDDMCKSGIIEIQTMYLEVINARREVQRALDLLDGKITAKRSVGAQPEPPGPVRNGEPAPAIRSEARSPRPPEPGPKYPEEPSEQLIAAAVQRGLSTPPRAHSEGDDARIDPNFVTNFEDPLNEPEESEEEMEEAQADE